MPKTITVTDIKLAEEVHFSRQDEEMPDGTFRERWFASVNYTLTNAQGELIQRGQTVELSTATRNTLRGVLTTLANQVKTAERV